MHAITDVVAIVKEECGTTHQVTSRARVTVAPRWLGGGHPRDLHPPTVRRPSWAPPHVSLTQRKFIDLIQDPCERRIQSPIPPSTTSSMSSILSIFASTPGRPVVRWSHSARVSGRLPAQVRCAALQVGFSRSHAASIHRSGSHPLRRPQLDWTGPEYVLDDG